MHIRRHNQGEWKQLCFDGFDSLRLQQGMAALGDHDRIDDEVGDFLRSQHAYDDLDDGGRRQHAGLDGSHVEIVEDGVELRGNDRGRQFEHICHFLGILSRDSGNHGHGEDTVRGHRLEIGLNSCASAGVRSGNSEYLLQRIRHDGLSKATCPRDPVWVRASIHQS